MKQLKPALAQVPFLPDVYRRIHILHSRWIISVLLTVAAAGSNLRAANVTFSLDIASPTLLKGFNPSDILSPGPNLFISGSSLGLSATDSFGDFSFGNDLRWTPRLRQSVNLLFAVR
jgi:hypothetical protein